MPHSYGQGINKSVEDGLPEEMCLNDKVKRVINGRTAKLKKHFFIVYPLWTPKSMMSTKVVLQELPNRNVRQTWKKSSQL